MFYKLISIGEYQDIYASLQGPFVICRVPPSSLQRKMKSVIVLKINQQQPDGIILYT